VKAIFADSTGSRSPILRTPATETHLQWMRNLLEPSFSPLLKSWVRSSHFLREILGFATARLEPCWNC
jgi:hypothetical protein